MGFPMTMNQARQIAGLGNAEGEKLAATLFPDCDPTETYWAAVEAVEDEFDRGIGPGWED